MTLRPITPRELHDYHNGDQVSFVYQPKVESDEQAYSIPVTGHMNELEIAEDLDKCSFAVSCFRRPLPAHTARRNFPSLQNVCGDEVFNLTHLVEAPHPTG